MLLQTLGVKLLDRIANRAVQLFALPAQQGFIGDFTGQNVPKSEFDIGGDALLLNVYHVIVVNPERHPGVREEVARRFRAFLLAPETQAEIGRFGVERFGEPLFTPAAE